MIVCVPDKLLAKWLEGKDYIVATDEGEAIGMGAGFYLATGKRAIIVISADGFCNALNPLTSLVIPEKIKMNLIISSGRQEPQHKVMSDSLEKILKTLKYDTKSLSVKILKKS